MRVIAAAIAASLMLPGGNAIAKSQHYTVSFDGTCIVANFTVIGNLVVANEDDDCMHWVAAGSIAKVKGETRALVSGYAENFLGGDELLDVFTSAGYVFVTGAPYTIYTTTDGKRLTKFATGTITVH
jgi:hypothetical protein